MATLAGDGWDKFPDREPPPMNEQDPGWAVGLLFGSVEQLATEAPVGTAGGSSSAAGSGGIGSPEIVHVSSMRLLTAWGIRPLAALSGRGVRAGGEGLQALDEALRDAVRQCASAPLASSSAGDGVGGTAREEGEGQVVGWIFVNAAWGVYAPQSVLDALKWQSSAQSPAGEAEAPEAAVETAVHTTAISRPLSILEEPWRLVLIVDGLKSCVYPRDPYLAAYICCASSGEVEETTVTISRPEEVPEEKYF